MQPLLVTPGDPRGVGPEVALKALQDPAAPPDVVLVGDGDALLAEARRQGVHLTRIHDLSTPASGLRFLDPEGHEPPEVRAIRWSVARCLEGTARGLVTGPIHKARLAAQGFGFPGHTDFLGHLCDVPDPVMAFVGGQLRVALVTVHLPLSAVPAAVTGHQVRHTIRTAHAALTAQLGLPTPRLLVCGLNPHAGDDGLLGTEERDTIAPAVATCRAEGIDAVGPMSAEAAFRMAMDGQGDLVVAMYHDQGLAPLKAVDFGRSVNWTLGLPIVRTSVDHGTADDIAGQGRADPTSMAAALAWAHTLTR